MTGRWLVARHALPQDKAHLCIPQGRRTSTYYAWACEPAVGYALGDWSMVPDDGRPRCKRCLAAEKKAKVTGA